MIFCLISIPWYVLDYVLDVKKPQVQVQVQVLKVQVQVQVQVLKVQVQVQVQVLKKLYSSTVKYKYQVRVLQVCMQ
jgi:hypothetical protein